MLVMMIHVNKVDPNCILIIRSDQLINLYFLGNNAAIIIIYHLHVGADTTVLYWIQVL